jgi:hypothetical protein
MGRNECKIYKNGKYRPLDRKNLLIDTCPLLNTGEVEIHVLYLTQVRWRYLSST